MTSNFGAGAMPSLSTARTFISTVVTPATTTASSVFGGSISSLPNFMSGRANMNFGESSEAKTHRAIARAIYVTGAPLNLLYHPLWKEVLNSLNPLYRNPTSKALGSIFLDQENTELHNNLTETLTKARVVHLTIDSWSNLHNESILNVVLHADNRSRDEKNRQDFFYKSIRTINKRQTPEYICDEISKIMEEFVAENFLGVITNDATNMIDCGRLLSQKYNNIHWFVCPLQTLKLMIGDIMKIAKTRKLFANIVTIIKTVTKSHALNTDYIKIAAENLINITLCLPVKTKWGSYLKSLQSFLKSKLILQTMVNNANSQLLSKYKKKLLDESTWDEIEKLEKVMKPIVEWMAKLEGKDNAVHLVHEAITEVYDVLGDYLKDDLRHKYGVRKSYILKPVHFAAAILDPKSQGAQLTPEEYIDGCEVILNLGDSLNADTLFKELTDYKCRHGLWSYGCDWLMAYVVEPYSWWNRNFNLMELSEIAQKILSIPATSAAVGSTFSSFSNILTKKKNKRSQMLSFISNNWNITNRSVENINTFEVDMDSSEDEFSDVLLSDDEESQSLETIQNVSGKAETAETDVSETSEY